MTQHKARSLRSTLLLWLLIPLAIILPLRAWVQYLDLVSETNAAFDRGLADTALALSNLVRLEHGRPHVVMSNETEVSLRADETDIEYFAVLDNQQRPVWGDAVLINAQRDQVTSINRMPGMHVFQSHIDGRPVRGVSKTFSCGPVLCEALAAETVNKRIVFERRALDSTVAFFSLLILALGFIAWLVITRTLRPLSVLSNEVSRRSLEDLRPLETARVPAEIQGLIESVNQLFTRLKQSADAQALFLTDAAHQLRTPLTSLRTEAELALLENVSDEIRPTLQRIHASAERASRLASQLLSQAREEARQQGPTHLEHYDLKWVAEEAAPEWVPQALRRAVDLGFQLESAPVYAEPYALRELLSNLIHNALEYGTPANGSEARITVRTRSEGGWSILEVEDNGLGIAPEERARVLERFQRGAHAPAGGSGLGLAIVRDITQRHGGRVELLDALDPTSTAKGLCVRISLPGYQPSGKAPPHGGGARDD